MVSETISKCKALSRVAESNQDTILINKNKVANY